MQNKRIKIGVIGFGRMGQGYCRELATHPRYELAYICDCDPRARSRAAESYPGAKVVEDRNAIFSDPSVMAVGLFTLADSRPDQIRRAVEAGKHILAEKPVANDVQTEWEMARLTEESGLVAAVNLFNRNSWYHLRMKEFIGEGEIGDLAIVRVCHMTPGHMPQEGHAPEGPAFHDCGMHYVDIARWYAGDEYDTFHAQGVRMWSHREPWWVQTHGAFRNGVVFDITQGFVYGHMSKDQTHNCYAEVIGTKGIARMSHDFFTARVELHGVTRTETLTEPFGDKKLDILIDQFARAVSGGQVPGMPTFRDSVIASDMAWKMYFDAVGNGAPCIGTPEEMDTILARRSTMIEGYGLPVR
jgi:myo-inositol 2-dehydrogenase/D-chiro-inositol 1-dehydrogenase